MLQDLRYAFRVLRGTPGVTAAAVAALALGIGANTAVFSLMDAAMLRPLPYPHSERLVYVSPTEGRHAMTSASWPVFREWQQQARSFESLAAYSASDSATLTGRGDPVRVHATPVTSEMFSVLGTAPLVGALQAPERTVVLSYGFWMRHFGGDRAALGRTLVLDGEAYTLAGVLPADFHFPRWMFMAEPDIYLPLRPNPDRNWHYLRVIGRLKVGVTVGEAQADMNVISSAIERSQPAGNRGEGVALGSLSDTLTYGTSDTLKGFAVAVLFVLIIACANVSNLLLGQTVRRRKEIAIRSALGASRTRLLRQFLLETVILALCGGSVGVLLAIVGTPLLMAILPVNSAFSVRAGMGGIGMNWTVLGFTLAISVSAAMLAGILPAWRASSLDRGMPFLASRSIQRDRVRGILIASEVALSLVLLAGAGLLVKSFVRLLSVDPGFNTRHLLTIEIGLPDYKYPVVRQRAEFVRSAVERLEHVPGVTAVAAINVMPLTKSAVTNGFTVMGSSRESGSAGLRVVTPGYFTAMGIPLIHGRLPTEGESGVGVINQAMVHRFWPSDDPLGKEIETPRVERIRMAQGWTTRRSLESFRIVGVVGDVRHLSLIYAPGPEMYLLYSQMATPDLTFVMRSLVEPGVLARAAERAILAVDSEQALGEIRTVDELISRDTSGRRFVLVILVVFAIFAVSLAAAGIFAVVSHSVSQRTREVGIRMALGANASAVIAAVVRQTLSWAAAGLLIGGAGSLAASRVLRAYLFAVEPRDPVALGAGAAILAAIAALAAFVPARRAVRVDPANALRCE